VVAVVAAVVLSQLSFLTLSSLHVLNTAGMFVTGGVTPKNIHFIEGQNSCFMTAYKDKGRVSALLDKIPLFAVMTEDLGVRGALKAASMVSGHNAIFCSCPI